MYAALTITEKLPVRVSTLNGKHYIACTADGLCLQFDGYDRQNIELARSLASELNVACDEIERRLAAADAAATAETSTNG